MKAYVVTTHKNRLEDVSDNESQNMFSLKKDGSLSLNYPCSPFLSGALRTGCWSGAVMVLGKLPVPGRPTYLD